MTDSTARAQRFEADATPAPAYLWAPPQKPVAVSIPLATIDQRSASGVRAIGFYRSHTRKGLYLDADDLALFDSRFKEPHHIALLIRPAATKVSMAGIFIRENDKVVAEASCLEFPFRSSQH